MSEDELILFEDSAEYRRVNLENNELISIFVKSIQTARRNK